MLATRPLCPNVVGSRCSMAWTAAFTNPSNRRSISSYSWLFSIATAAWPARAVTSSTVRFEKGTTSSWTSCVVASTASKLRLRLISCSTPITRSL